MDRIAGTFKNCNIYKLANSCFMLLQNAVSFLADSEESDMENGGDEWDD